jgi:hypothetical protein
MPPSPRLFPSLCAALALALPAAAATGCDLNTPESDVRRLFPGSTGYKTAFFSLDPEQLRRAYARLGEANRFLYDPLNVPYTLYEVYRDGRKVGYVHGVNQKGQFGGLQVFVSLDLRGRIVGFYLQKITGSQAGRFREPAFGRQFQGLALADFDGFDAAGGRPGGRLARLCNPVPEMETDFYGVLRALKKNLVLMHEVVYREREEAP